MHPAPTISVVSRFLASARRRALVGALLRGTGHGVAFACTAALLGLGLIRLLPQISTAWLSAGTMTILLSSLGALGLLGGVALALHRRPCWRELVDQLDQTLRLQARLSTVAALEAGAKADRDVAEYVRSDAARQLDGVRVGQALPLDAGRAWIMAGAAAMVLLVAFWLLPRREGMDPEPPPPPEFAHARAETADEIRQAVASVRDAARTEALAGVGTSSPPSPLVQERLDALERLAAQLDPASAPPPMPVRTPEEERALAASLLEELAAIRESEAITAASEADALAQRFSALARTQKPEATVDRLGEFGEALREGRLEDAASIRDALDHPTGETSAGERQAMAEYLQQLARQAAATHEAGGADQDQQGGREARTPTTDDTTARRLESESRGEQAAESPNAQQFSRTEPSASPSATPPEAPSSERGATRPLTDAGAEPSSTRESTPGSQPRADDAASPADPVADVLRRAAQRLQERPSAPPQETAPGENAQPTKTGEAQSPPLPSRQPDQVDGPGQQPTDRAAARHSDPSPAASPPTAGREPKTSEVREGSSELAGPDPADSPSASPSRPDGEAAVTPRDVSADGPGAARASSAPPRTPREDSLSQMLRETAERRASEARGAEDARALRQQAERITRGGEGSGEPSAAEEERQRQQDRWSRALARERGQRPASADSASGGSDAARSQAERDGSLSAVEQASTDGRSGTRGSSQAGRSDGSSGSATEPSANSASSLDPGVRLEELDLRRDPRGRPRGEVIAEWFDNAPADSSGGSSQRPLIDRVEAARRAAERAVERSDVPPRHHDLLRRYFRRFGDAVDRSAPPAPPFPPAAGPSNETP